MSTTKTRPVLNRVSLLVLAGALGSAVAVVAAVGCTKTNLFSADQESVVPDSPEITFESYRDRKVLIVVPPGNRNPKVSWPTLNSRKNLPAKLYEKFGHLSTADLRVELDGRFRTAIKDLASDPKTLAEIQKAGQIYGIDPALIVAAVMGEHVYNTPLVMMAQDGAMRGVLKSWATRWTVHFTSNGTSLSDLLKEAPFNVCGSPQGLQSDYWECVQDVFERSYRNKPKENPRFTSSLKWQFFNPIRSGLTYGLGQLDPIRALMVTDRVNRMSGFPYVTIENPTGIYEAILDSRSSVHYVAANIAVTLEVYRNLANFDISQNLGLVATLYNLGREKEHANERYGETLKSLKLNRPIELPVESYYGFFMNEKEQAIRHYVATGRLQ